MDIRLMHLPQGLKKIALERAREQGYSMNEDSPISRFLWSLTKEGDKFWRNIRDTGIIPDEWQECSYEIY